MEHDLADRLDDLICAFDAGFEGASNHIESIVFVLLAWLVLAVSVYIVVYRLFKTHQSSRDDEVDLPPTDGKEIPVEAELVEVKKDLQNGVGVERQEQPVPVETSSKQGT